MTTTESTPATGRGRTTAADRVPVPTRQRRPGLAALAIVLILGGAALSGYLAITSGNKTSVIALARDVEDGNLITAADLTTISVSAPGVNTVPASELDNVVKRQYRARGTYPRGLILVNGMLRGYHIPGEGYVSIALIVSEGQFPPQTITPGSAVKVLYSPKNGGASQNNNAPPTVNIAPGSALVDAAYVLSTKTASNGGGIFTIVVANGDQQDGQRVANLVNANALGAITLLALPESVHPATGEGQS
jgi:hypothetical protein